MRLALVGFIFFWCVIPATAGNANVAADKLARLDTLLDQNLDYDLGFLWIDRVAVANFKLQKSTRPDLYIASLTARTQGVAARLTSNRRQSYVSMMRLMPDGSFRSVRHTSQKISGGVVREKVYVFDYEAGVVHYEYHKNYKLIDNYQIELEAAGYPSDVLTTYFNLVAGAFGPMEVGARYEVPAFSKKGVGQIVIEFLPSEASPNRSFIDENLLLCRVIVDQDFFDTKDGIIYIGYDKKRRPARGIVTDIIGMGDVRGVMKSSAVAQ